MQYQEIHKEKKENMFEHFGGLPFNMNAAFKNTKSNFSADPKNSVVTLNLPHGYQRPIENEDNLCSIISDRSEHFVQITLKGMMNNNLHNQELSNPQFLMAKDSEKINALRAFKKKQEMLAME
jgi:hypothetical protein